MKTCSECKNEYPVLWKAKTKEHGSLCKDCWQRYKSGETSLKKSKNTLKRKGSLKPVSDKRAKELVEYRKVRDKFLKEVKVCQFPDCDSEQIELHHGAGRVGRLLTDPTYFVALCRKHHRFVEENPLVAKEINLSFERINKC